MGQKVSLNFARIPQSSRLEFVFVYVFSNAKELWVELKRKEGERIC